MSENKRGDIKVDISLFRNYLETKYNVYARDNTIVNGIELPLVLSVSMASNFIVSLGPDMLYNGDDISEAIKIFNSNIEDLKNLWIHLDPEMRGKVHLPEKRKSDSGASSVPE